MKKGVFLIFFLCIGFSSFCDEKMGSSAERFYKQALETKEMGAKKELLNQAIREDPYLIKAKEKLASIYLAEKNWEKSYLLWLDVLKLQPCNVSAIRAFKVIGKHWLQDASRTDEELVIYEYINRCSPNNADTLYYYGRALYQTGNFDQSKQILEQCLALAPDYPDAQILLGYIAMQEGKFDKSKAIFEAYPKNPDAIAGLKLLRQGERKNRLAEARAAHGELNYTRAQENYAWLLQDDSDSFRYWPAVMDIKSHTKPSIVVETTYTDAKENDPGVRAPVVKDYYFLNKVHLRIPILNSWRLDLQEIYYHQRENDIYPPVGVNYSAYSNGGELMSQVYFAKYWRWDLSGRVFRMTGTQNANFPFNNSTRFEPGTTLFYNDGKILFALNAHRESYIIKNFTTFRSYLLSTDYLSGGGAYRAGEKVRLEVEGWVYHIWIKDSLHNWKNSEDVLAKLSVPVPRLRDHFTVLYHFEHGHYDKLNLNYYSYKQQLRNTLGLRFHYDIQNMIRWDVTYEHRWQTTYQLFQPIGIFILVQNKQYLIANRISSTLSVQYQDRLRLQIGGHYFYESLPYRDWNLNGSLVWQF